MNLTLNITFLGCQQRCGCGAGNCPVDASAARLGGTPSYGSETNPWRAFYRKYFSNALTDPLNLAAVAEDALEERTASGITTTTTLGEAPVTGDGVLLERLVANLLDNAERYNIPGGTVSISTTTDNRAAVVRVVNSGRVIPPDQVDRLFLPFTRLDDRTRHDGFGLGLALVSSIATVHNGTVHATAVSTGGLDITVRLPRRDNAVSPASAA
jgi:signal transduction histidine kinase